jgi:hypothetical protein
MRIQHIFLFTFSISIFSINKVNCQSTDKPNRFSLDGEITGRDTGSVILWHFDKNNKYLVDAGRKLLRFK